MWGGIKDHRDYKTACSSGTGDRPLWTISKREDRQSLQKTETGKVVPLRPWTGPEGSRRLKKNSNDTIGNRTRDLQTYSAVPKPNEPPRNPIHVKNQLLLSDSNKICIFSTLFFEKYSNTKCQENPSMRAELFRVDGRTNMTKPMSLFALL
jgi:hypothetical protein